VNGWAANMQVGASGMDRETKEKAFRSKAQEAEEEAAKSKDIDAKKSWLKIAADYRQLAAELRLG
jgi:hypothetical protein